MKISRPDHFISSDSESECDRKFPTPLPSLLDTVCDTKHISRPVVPHKLDGNTMVQSLSAISFDQNGDVLRSADFNMNKGHDVDSLGWSSFDVPGDPAVPGLMPETADVSEQFTLHPGTFDVVLCVDNLEYYCGWVR